MNKNQAGFSLIEVLIASGIATILTAALFAFVWQSNKGAAALDWAVDAHFKAIILQRTIERDVAGACVPASLFAYHEQQAQEQKQKNKQASAIGSTQEKKIKKIEKVFYAVAHNNELLMTFISNNPLPVYADAQTGTPQPRLVRVTYRLKPEKESNKKRYALWREESTDLEFNEQATTASYQLANEIKECQVTFVSYDEVAGNDAQAQKKEKEAQKVTEWDRENTEFANGKPEQPLVPTMAIFAITLAQPTGSRSMKLEFAVAVLPSFGPFPAFVVSKQEQAPVKTPAQSPVPNALKAPGAAQPPAAGTPSAVAPASPVPGLLPVGDKQGIKGISQRPRAASLQTLFGIGR